MELWVTEEHLKAVRLSYKITETLYHGESSFQKIDVVDTVAYGRMLLLDGLVMTTEKDEFVYHEMISHIPMLAHPNPKKVLVIGGGDGGTVREVLKHPSVEEVVLCEIDGDVIDVSRRFLPSIAGKLDDPRVDIQVRDGVAYIAEQKNRFDVILIDSTDPIGPGEGLFTEEFYHNVKAALTENGIMANQSESPIANPREIRLVYALLGRVFPTVTPYVATIPTYPGHYWSWAFCSESRKPADGFDNPVAAELEKGCKFFNRDVHKAVFALPNFVRERIYGEIGVGASC